MKQPILLLITIIIIFVLGFTYNNTTVFKGNIISDTVFYIPPHVKASFKDSDVVVTGSASFVQVTNPGDSLFNIYETNGMTYIKGDTFQIKYKGGYTIIGMISGYGSVNTDWTVQWAVKRAGVTTYGDAAIQFTTTGATNINGGSSTGYGEFLPGDKLFMVIKRDAGVGDITLTTAKFCPMLFYRTN